MLVALRTEDREAHLSKWKVREKVWGVAEEIKNSSMNEDCQQVQGTSGKMGKDGSGGKGNASDGIDYFFQK